MDRIALATGADQGVGKQVAKELAEHGVTVLVGSREVVRVARLGPDGPTGTFTRWEGTAIPW